MKVIDIRFEGEVITIPFKDYKEGVHVPTNERVYEREMEDNKLVQDKFDKQIEKLEKEIDEDIDEVLEEKEETKKKSKKA